MNQQLQEFARGVLKSGLARCTRAQRLMFNRMYSPNNLECDVGEVVDAMPEEKLDSAMEQVRRTLGENEAGDVWGDDEREVRENG